MTAGVATLLLRKPALKAPMRTEPRLTLEARTGITGDCHAHPLGPRQVLVVREEALDELGVEAAALRANLVVRGIPQDSMRSGRVLTFPSGARIRLTHACETCSALREHIDREAFRSLPGRRGMLGVVLHGGGIDEGDRVAIDPGERYPMVPDTVGERVAWALARVPVGRTITYRALIELVGGTRAHFRALPAHLRRADASGLPAHRVLTSSGELTGHVADQAARLRAEVADGHPPWAAEGLYFEPE